MENHYLKSTFKVKLSKLLLKTGYLTKLLPQSHFKLKLAKIITSNGKYNKIFTLNPKLAKNHYFK